MALKLNVSDRKKNKIKSNLTNANVFYTKKVIVCSGGLEDTVEIR